MEAGELRLLILESAQDPTHLSCFRQVDKVFSIDAIKQTQKTAIDISAEQLDQHVQQGYGIFAGKSPLTPNSNSAEKYLLESVEKIGTQTR